MKIASLLSLFAFTKNIDAFGVNQHNVAKASADTQLSRSNFLALVGAGVTVATCNVPLAFAKDGDDLKGTKKDPVFEACLSTCMYECTKPKGVEQKSRKECLPECKSKCATNKNQLLLGDPKAAE